MLRGIRNLLAAYISNFSGVSGVSQHVTGKLATSWQHVGDVHKLLTSYAEVTRKLVPWNLALTQQLELLALRSESIFCIMLFTLSSI